MKTDASDLETRIGTPGTKGVVKRHLLDGVYGASFGLAVMGSLELATALLIDGVEWRSVLQSGEMLPALREQLSFSSTDYLEAAKSTFNTRWPMALGNIMGTSRLYSAYRAGFLKYRGIDQDSSAKESWGSEFLCALAFWGPIYTNVRALSGVSTYALLGSFGGAIVANLFLAERYGKMRDRWFHLWGEPAIRAGSGEELESPAAKFLNLSVSDAARRTAQGIRNRSYPVRNCIGEFLQNMGYWC